MVLIIVGIGCFISGGMTGAIIMAILTVSKHADNSAEVMYQNKNKT